MTHKNYHFRNLISTFWDIHETTGLKKQDIHDLWIYVADGPKTIQTKRDQLLETVKTLRNRNLWEYVANWSGMFSCPDNIRQLFYNWERKVRPKDEYLVSFLILICMISLHGKECFSSDYPYFKENTFPLDDMFSFLYIELSEHIPESVKKDPKSAEYAEVLQSIKCSSEYQQFLTVLQHSEKHLVAFLFAGILHCRHADDCLKKEREVTYDLKKWLEHAFDQFSKAQSDATLTTFQKDYLEFLWKENKILNLRDAPGTITSENPKHDLVNLYVVPALRNHAGALTSLFHGSDRFSHIITANSGAGKSSLIQALVMGCTYSMLDTLGSELAQSVSATKYKRLQASFRVEKAYFPVLVKSSVFNKEKLQEQKDYKLLHYASGPSCEQFDTHMEALLSEADSMGTLLLLVDALDELDQSHATVFGDMIDDFLREYPNTSLLVTSRLIHFREFQDHTFFANAVPLTLDLFDEQKIIQLIANWTKHNVFQAGSYDWRDLKTFLSGYPHLYTLVKNPYMLSHAIYYKVNNRHAAPEEIISYIIDNIIEKRWPEKKYGVYGISASYMRGLLSCLAWEMAKSGQHYIPPQKLVKRFRQAGESYDEDVELDLKTWNSIANEMNTQAGLLVLGSPDTEKTAMEKDNYVFQLDVIEHFLAAEWIRTQLRNEGFRKDMNDYRLLEQVNEFFPEQITKKHWTDIILMLFYPVTELHAKTRESSITLAIYKHLLHRTSETLSEEELSAIGTIFKHLLCETFGTNILTSADEPHSHTLRLQMLRYLANTPGIKSELADISKNNLFPEEFKTLQKLKLIIS